MSAIVENIKTFHKETDESVKELIAGSDEHLDIILSITKPLNSINEKFHKFNDSLYDAISKCSDDQLEKEVMPILWDLNKSCLSLIGALSNSRVYSDIRISLKEYHKQYSLLREVIHDIHHFRLAKDNEFENVLKELNAK